jgi:hypothetical protein
MTACSAEQPLTIAAGSSAIDIVTATETRRLQAGDSARVIGDDVESANGAFEPLLDASWMHPLLIQKGFADSELNERVNGLLAQLGRAKMSFLFERDIRGLGEYSALPLLRFVESTLSEEDVGRRQQAASILADVAPAWMVPDLIALLGDTDPVVRVAAARALTRLTGQTQGISPEQWRESGDVWGSAHERWLAWWNENRRVYAARPAGVTQTRLPALAPEQMLKARQQ